MTSPRTCLAALTALVVIFMTGCATLGPAPTGPEDFFTVTVNSIPTGASVYEVDASDGSLGQLLGRTPYDLRIGLATRRWSDGRRSFGGGNVSKWGAGVEWSEYRSDKNGWDLLLNVAVAKDGYYASRVTNKCVGTVGYGQRYPPSDTTLTVPLRPVADTSDRAPQQQQQQQQQQTVVIPGGGSSAASSRGMVMVTSAPDNSEIYVDGAFVGNAPANLKLTEGIHIIEVKRTGFKPYKKELRVIGSSELNLRVNLEPE